MEVYSAIALLLSWQPEYESKIAWEVWGDITTKIAKDLERLKDVHIARCRTGDVILQEVYNEILEKLAEKASVAGAVAPGNYLRVREKLLAVAQAAQARVEAMWRVLEIGEHQEAREKLEVALELQLRALDVESAIRRASGCG